MRRYTVFLILFLGLLPHTLWAQLPITAEFSRGCAPFMVQLDTTNLDEEAYVVVYDSAEGTTTDLTYTYSDPGTYIIEVFAQSAFYDIEITVDEPVAPVFEVLTCSGHQVRVQLNSPIYDRYNLIFNATDTVPGYDSVLDYTYAFGGAGTYSIDVEGYFDQGLQNCPVSSATITTRDSLLAPTLNSVTPSSLTQLQMQLELAANTDHRLEVAVDNNTLPETYALPGSGTVQRAQTVSGGSFHCVQAVAYDVCSGTVERSEQVCTATLTAEAFPNYNELTWNSAALPGTQYVIEKDGSTLISETAVPPSTARDSAVECNVPYTYQVRLVHAGGGIGYSLPHTITGLAPTTPQLLAAPAASVVSGVALRWQPPTLGEASEYRISRAGQRLDSLLAPTTTYADDTATPEAGPVCYTVAYQDVCGNESGESAQACTIYLTQGPASGTDILVEWTGYVGDTVQDYEVVVTDETGGPFGTYSASTNLQYSIGVGNAPPQAITVVVRATLADGTTVLSNPITIEFITTLGIPTAFSPDGDGLNEVFNIKGNFIDQSQMWIYNRWGELVYTSDAPHLEAGWNGTYAGIPAPTGLYTYLVRISDLNGRTIERRGQVFLIRER